MIEQYKSSQQPPTLLQLKDNSSDSVGIIVSNLNVTETFILVSCNQGPPVRIKHDT